MNRRAFLSERWRQRSPRRSSSGRSRRGKCNASATSLLVGAPLPVIWRTHSSQGLREVGYVIGRDVVVEYRHAENRYERLPSIVRELMDAKVDVVVAATNPRIIAARAATAEIPIVMVRAADPIGAASSRAWRDRAGTSPGFPSRPGAFEARAWITSAEGHGSMLEEDAASTTE
ncbi:MAG: ABC transporter substrate binding protein [Candidatus Rokuibacteriota bacterium]